MCIVASLSPAVPRLQCLAPAMDLSAPLKQTSAALVELTDPVSLARLATETGSVPLSTRLLLRVVKGASGLVRRADGTINRRLADLLEYKVPASSVPDRYGNSTRDVVIDAQKGIWARVFLPQAKLSEEFSDPGMDFVGAAAEMEAETRVGKKQVVFYFHGGGFAVMSADGFTYDMFCRRLCKRLDAVVISVNYRRSPEHRYPAAYDDCYAAVEWLEGSRGDLFKPHELDLSRCVLMGDSAGANIVHHVGCRWAARVAGATSSSSPPPSPPSSSSSSSSSCQLRVAAHVLLFPFFGGERRMPSELRLDVQKSLLVSVENLDWHWRAFLPPGATRDHPASNVFGADAPDISGLPLPPSLVVVAEFDMLKDWQLNYAQGLRRASKGVRLLYYVGGVHSFHVVSNTKLTSHMLTDITSFIKDCVSQPNKAANEGEIAVTMVA